MKPRHNSWLCTASQLQWRHVAASAVSQTLYLDDDYYNVAFGVSTERLLMLATSAGTVTMTTSSGITWADCVYLSHAGRRAR